MKIIHVQGILATREYLGENEIQEYQIRELNVMFYFLNLKTGEFFSKRLCLKYVHIYPQKLAILLSKSCGITDNELEISSAVVYKEVENRGASSRGTQRS